RQAPWPPWRQPVAPHRGAAAGPFVPRGTLSTTSGERGCSRSARGGSATPGSASAQIAAKEAARRRRAHHWLTRLGQEQLVQTAGSGSPLQRHTTVSAVR